MINGFVCHLQAVPRATIQKNHQRKRIAHAFADEIGKQGFDKNQQNNQHHARKQPVQMLFRQFATQFLLAMWAFQAA